MFSMIENTSYEEDEMMEEPQKNQDENEIMKQEEQAQQNEGVVGEAQRIAELEAQLGQARQEAAENWNKYVRERAEMDNFRKRQERIAGDRVVREKKALIHKVLEVTD